MALILANPAAGTRDIINELNKVMKVIESTTMPEKDF